MIIYIISRAPAGPAGDTRRARKSSYLIYLFTMNIYIYKHIYCFDTREKNGKKTETGEGTAVSHRIRMRLEGEE